jgi:hypothetical protein
VWAGAAAFFGFVSMCIWAGYSNKLDHVYGSSFVLVTVSWLLFLLATISGAWELGKGIPAQVQRVFNVGTNCVDGSRTR